MKLRPNQGEPHTRAWSLSGLARVTDELLQVISTFVVAAMNLYIASFVVKTAFQIYEGGWGRRERRETKHTRHQSSKVLKA